MEYRDELQKLQHQLELADRAIPLICDAATVERLQRFAKSIRNRLDELEATALREQTSHRAFELWRESGRPDGRDLEFWLRAESEQAGKSGASCEPNGINETRAEGPERCVLRDQNAVETIRNRGRADGLNWRSSFPADRWPALPLPLSPEAPQGEAVLCREVHMTQVYKDDIRARAYKLWEGAGKPDGQMDEFWHEAERQLKEEQVRHVLKTPDAL
ncbi:DUF2934 domain-containing protein [Bradyrhizobium sp. Arg816]|uniref:DUF2934 domain-containing protein n=1 Tax=Bradyrhizobium sp. Arg816 TaxID=2998491 RepID=UPI00249E65A4|nr:DUF2934 domain-containing protein [Bradyrhizobium sp. Arg816]MDI3567444.1 DUF2934 domain-containing protein [Bradyrhizobium sp. Arg816]